MGRPLTEIAAELTGLCGELEKAASLTEANREKLWYRAADAVSEMENNHGVITFRPEVPAETQKMFFTLQKFVIEG